MAKGKARKAQKDKTVEDWREEVAHCQAVLDAACAGLLRAQEAALPFTAGSVIEGKISHVYRANGGGEWRPFRVTNIRFDTWRGVEVRGVFQLKGSQDWGTKVWTLVDWRLPQELEVK